MVLNFLAIWKLLRPFECQSEVSRFQALGASATSLGSKNLRAKFQELRDLVGGILRSLETIDKIAFSQAEFAFWEGSFLFGFVQSA